MIFAVFRFMVIHIALTHCYKLESFFYINVKNKRRNKSQINYSCGVIASTAYTTSQQRRKLK